MYQIEFSEEARKELYKMMKSDVQAYKKFKVLYLNSKNTPIQERDTHTNCGM